MNDERWAMNGRRKDLSPRVHKFPLLNGTSTAPVITAHFNIPGNTSCLAPSVLGGKRHKSRTSLLVVGIRERDP